MSLTICTQSSLRAPPPTERICSIRCPVTSSSRSRCSLSSKPTPSSTDRYRCAGVCRLRGVPVRQGEQTLGPDRHGCGGRVDVAERPAELLPAPGGDVSGGIEHRLQRVLPRPEAGERAEGRIPQVLVG